MTSGRPSTATSLCAWSVPTASTSTGYVPVRQVGGQVVSFLCDRRDAPMPSPALLGQMTRSFVLAVERYAEDHRVPARGGRPASRGGADRGARRQ